MIRVRAATARVDPRLNLSWLQAARKGDAQYVEQQ